MSDKKKEMVQWIKFPPLGDDRGSLVALEGNRSVPFDIRRVYYISGVQSGVARGFHAHKTLKQVAICVTGSCKMLLDNGTKKSEVRLGSPTKGLLIEEMVWHEMHDFSQDCLLLVLASEHYDESDYIRDYKTFLKMSSEKF